MKNKIMKKMLWGLLIVFGVIGIASTAKVELHAETVKEVKGKKMTVLKGQTLFGDEIYSIDEDFPRFVSVSKISYSKAGIAEWKDNVKEHECFGGKLTGKKVGSVTIKIEGKEENTDEDTYEDEPYIKCSYTFPVQVISNKATQKKAASKAKALLKKVSSKASVAYVDLNFDGIKDIFVDGKVYIYSIKKGTYKKVGRSNHKIVKVYIDKSKESVMFMMKGTIKKTSKNPTSAYSKYVEVCYDIYDMNQGNYDECVSYGMSKLTPLGKKVLKKSQLYTYDLHGEGGMSWYPEVAITKTKFNKYLKKWMPKRKLVKTYKNTSSVRKKIIK